jgi:hypothetical protein
VSEQIKGGGPAFPTLDFMTPERVATNRPGMTLRDYFAAKAMPAIYKDYWEGVRLHEFSCDDETWPMNLAMDAYRIADAMLAAREAKP